MTEASDQTPPPSESTPPSEATSEPVSTDAPSFLSPWLWVIAGIVGGIAVTFAAQTVLSSPVPLPDEYHQLNELQVPSAEDGARANELKQANRFANQSRLLFASGIVFSVVIGLFAGIISRRLMMGIVGAVVGAVIAVGLTFAVTPTILNLEVNAMADASGGDTTAMMLHGLQWLVLGVAAAVAAAVGVGSVSMGGKAVFSMGLAAVLGGILYVIVGTILDPNTSTSSALPVQGTALYLWTVVPPLVAGLFLARMKQ